MNREAVNAVEQNGIVFIDEIDKVAARAETRGADVSREGVQRDLLPLIEGTTVSTKYGPVKTDHILFIASGAFSIAKPSDLLPELQGRLPIRVELRALTEADFVRILTETDNALTRQYAALMQTEKVAVDFTEDGIAALARIAAEVNRAVENIGARRLHTVLERVFEDLSFTAPDRPGDAVTRRRGLRREAPGRAQPLGRPQPLRALSRAGQACAGSGCARRRPGSGEASSDSQVRAERGRDEGNRSRQTSRSEVPSSGCQPEQTAIPAAAEADDDGNDQADDEPWIHCRFLPVVPIPAGFGLKKS